MQVHTFIAESAADAVAQIRAQLGPEALVLNVRPLPAEGLARLWQKRRIEVLACPPEDSALVAAPAAAPRAALSQETLPLPQRLQAAYATPDSSENTSRPPSPSQPVPEPVGSAFPPHTGAWRVDGFLESSGLASVHAARIVEELRTVHGDTAPVSFGRELELAAGWLRQLWHRTTPENRTDSGAHVLVGPPGVGKTVSLCKWLAQTVLVEGRTASVWRLDGRTANTAETLSVYGEILGLPVERLVPDCLDPAAQELLFIDLPGTSSNDSVALQHLREQIKQLPHPQVHLVLNAAYELPLLQAQVRAFSVLPLTDLIFTHLDEEVRWGKLWNFVLGTNFWIRFLSAGQNIPGDWVEATAEQILSRQFPRK